MYQRLIIISATAFLLLILATGVFAHEDLDNLQAGRVGDRLEELRLNRQEEREEAEDRLDEIKQKIEKRRLEVKQKVASRQAETREKTVKKIKEVFTRILTRFEAALERLDKIADRIASRIDKLNEKGVNTQKAETELTEAEALGLSAEVAIASASAQIEGIDASNTSVKDAVSQATMAMRLAKQALFDYHKALVESIRQLKAAKELREATESAN